MKAINIFLIAITLILFQLTNAFSQSSIGLRGGFSAFTVKNLPVEGVEGTIGEKLSWGNYNALSFEIGLSPRFAIQPEITYLQKGGKLCFCSMDDAGLNDYYHFENEKPTGHDITRWEGLAVSLGYQYEFGGRN